jgi:hypothetical protein
MNIRRSPPRCRDLGVRIGFPVRLSRKEDGIEGEEEASDGDEREDEEQDGLPSSHDEARTSANEALGVCLM